ncbi:MAG TPA: hypothetical protein ENI95_14465 [Chloroflexi bacterium]|nr:hypothetical protein [Chloroflexota bacterium]
MRHYGDILKEDLPGLLLLGLLLMMPAGAVITARWTDNLWVLSTITLLSLAASYLLVISRFSDLTTTLFSTVYGVFAVWVLVGNRFLPGTLTLRERMLEVLFRFSVWFEQALEGGISRDNLIFVSLLGLLAWFLAFNAVANLFRAQRLWHAVIPPGLALLINAYYYYGPARMDLFLIGYLFLAFTLAVRTNAVIRERIWRQKRIGYTPGIRFDLLRAGVISVVLLIAVAWALPAASASSKLVSAWDRSDNPWYQLQDTFNRLFGGVEGGRAITPDYYGGPVLQMGGPVSLGNNTVMYVHAPQGYRYYWRSKLFDIYSDGRWFTRNEARLGSDFGLLRYEEDEAYALRRNVQQRFEIAIPATRLLYAAPQPVSFSSLPIWYDAVYTFPGSSEYATVTAVQARDLITAGEGYGATSSISIADEASLRAAGTDYPAWVRERYLQLPESITGRTRSLAARLAEPYDNPYDVARAIETYLRHNITYNEGVAPPPPDVEPVDYLLFERPEGYCNYYASAMTVMLRSLGIPARIAAGFAQGEYDEELGAYRVLESDAHTWVEVYFPGYGWIEFEPTVSEQPIIRPERSTETGGVGAAGQSEQSPDGGLSEEEEPSPDDSLQPEDEQTSDLPQTHRGIRLPAVAWWLLGLLLIGLMAVAGGWFWVEQRGLLHLSDVARSYARLNIYAPWLGVTVEPGDTPLERAGRISAAVPDAQEPVQQIVGLYIEEQYAPPPPTPMHRDRANTYAREAWEKARRTFLIAALRRTVKRLVPFRWGDGGESE